MQSKTNSSKNTDAKAKPDIHTYQKGVDAIGTPTADTGKASLGNNSEEIGDSEFGRVAHQNNKAKPHPG